MKVTKLQHYSTDQLLEELKSRALGVLLGAFIVSDEGKAEYVGLCDGDPRLLSGILPFLEAKVDEAIFDIMPDPFELDDEEEE